MTSSIPLAQNISSHYLAYQNNSAVQANGIPADRLVQQCDLHTFCMTTYMRLYHEFIDHRGQCALKDGVAALGMWVNLEGDRNIGTATGL